MARSFRLRALGLALRLFVKSALKWMRTPRGLRDRFERDAARFFRAPDGSNFVADTVRRDQDNALAGLIPALWASRGRPDRHRVILYLHGGAYLAGSSRTHRHLGAALAGVAGVRTMLPDYRLAPEHPFPAALEDALAAYRHLIASGYDGDRIALAGDSAGGGLVFALCLKLMEQGIELPACLVGFSPWTDLTMTRPSLTSNARRDMLLPVARFAEVAEFVLAGADPRDPFASPAYGSFKAPPPALITASKTEILRDDATAMAENLRAAGGDVTLELWKDMPHAWPIFAGAIREADETVARAGRFIARHLGAAGGKE